MRTAVFIDGGNFYRRLKESKIRNIGRFDVHKLISEITYGTELVYAGYYVGQIRCEKNNPKSFILDAKQQKWFSHLKSNFSQIKIIKGYIQNFNGIYREKGVDVRLALDLYKLAVDGTYDKAFLISSDTDLIPAIQMVQDLGKQVGYVGFSNNPALSMITACRSNKLLSLADLQ